MARTVLRGRDGGNVILLPDYLKDYETPHQATRELGQYFAFYNERRLHQALAYQTPAVVYFGS